MKKRLKLIYNGIIPGNPVFVLLLGMCATLGTTSSALNGLMMGLTTALVLICSNAAIAMMKNLIPDKVRIPAYIVIIASFVTILQLAVKAWAPALDSSLGIFIPLIVVNCILLGRAEAFAGKNSVIDSVCDGLGCGIGFIFALTLLGACRELLGVGKIFGIEIFPEDYGMLVFVLAPGAFIALGYLIAIVNKIRKTC
jgi:electron transport complex protein RnfE